MRKSKFKDGLPFFGIKVEHFVTKGVFAKAIASHCWTYDLEFDQKISKREAMKILKKQLFHQGVSGLDTGGWDGADEAFSVPFDDAYAKAIKWIENKYPYLK